MKSDSEGCPPGAVCAAWSVSSVRSPQNYTSPWSRAGRPRAGHPGPRGGQEGAVNSGPLTGSSEGQTSPPGVRPSAQFLGVTDFSPVPKHQENE